jgi:hypothetical protein
MNSTTSTKAEIGAEYYVPFWILLEFLDTAPPDPFIRVEVLATETRFGTGPDGPIEVLCCDLMCNGKKQLVAHKIPAQYLITPDSLPEWAERIANWFNDFGEQESQT